MKKQSKSKKQHPIVKKEEVKRNPDPRIDEDFPGFPDPPASEKLIKPKSEKDKKIARVDKEEEND